MPLDVDRIRAVLFDLDGTLADTDDEFIQRTGERIRRLHFLFPQRDPTNFLRWSLLISEAPLNLLMGLPDWLGVDDELARFFDWLADRRAARGRPSAAGLTGLIPKTSGHFVLMAGVEPLLARLGERYPLGVVTARGERAALSFLDQFDLKRHFRTIASAQTAPHTKPYPDPVLWSARELGVPVESCVMIGDTPVDILAGRRAGAQTVGVLCGFGQRGELERSGADLILEHTADVGPVLMAAGPAD